MNAFIKETISLNLTNVLDVSKVNVDNQMQYVVSSLSLYNKSRAKVTRAAVLRHVIK